MSWLADHCYGRTCCMEMNYFYYFRSKCALVSYQALGASCNTPLGRLTADRVALGRPVRDQRSIKRPEHILHRLYAEPVVMSANLDSSTLTWQEGCTGASPSLPRSGHCAVSLPAKGDGDNVLIFGGYTETAEKRRQAANDAWVFDSSTKAWSELTFEGPVPRARLVATLTRVGSSAFMVGGWDPGMTGDGGDVLDDVWELKLGADTHLAPTWLKVELQGLPLQPVSRHAAAAIGDAVWLYTQRCGDHMLRLDTCAQGGPRLEEVAVASPQGAPPSRDLASLTAVGSTLYVFAGALQRGDMLADLWRLDTSAAELTWEPLQAAGPAPHPRCSHTAAAVGGNIVYHGGSYYRKEGGLQPLGEILVLDISNMRWQYPEVRGGQPLPRNAATMTPICTASEDNLQHLLLHGGWLPFIQTYNDTWTLSHNEEV